MRSSYMFAEPYSFLAFAVHPRDFTVLVFVISQSFFKTGLEPSSLEAKKKTRPDLNCPFLRLCCYCYRGIHFDRET